MKLNTTAQNIYACLAGFCLFAIAMGINRFSYTPIIPFLVNSHWTTIPQAGYVGSANFLGYFFSALTAHRLTRFFKLNRIMIAVLVVSLIASFLCMFNFGYLWLSLWRLVVGFTAGLIMVLTPTIVLSGVADDKKPLISSIVFAGIGLGIAGASLLVPVFNLWNGLVGIWLGLTVLTLIFGGIAFSKCYNATSCVENKTTPQAAFKLQGDARRAFLFAIVGFGIYGFSLAPSLLFLPDYAHRTLHASLSISSMLFALLGVGCVVGSLIGGWLHNKFGSYWAIIVTSIIGLISLALTVFIPSVIAVAVSSFLIGFYLLALVVLMSLFTGSLVGMQRHAQYWAYMTVIYAAAQFVGGYFFSYVLNYQVSYLETFWAGLIILIFSLLCFVFIRHKKKITA